MTHHLIRGDRYGTGDCPACGEFVVGGVYDADSGDGPFCDADCALESGLTAGARLVAALACAEQDGAEPMEAPEEEFGRRLHLEQRECDGECNG